MNEKLTTEQREKIRDVLEYIKYQSVYRNPALDHVQMYMPNETVDNALAGLVALTANTTEDDDYMVWAISAENQITLRKIEEFIQWHGKFNSSQELILDLLKERLQQDGE